MASMNAFFFRRLLGDEVKHECKEISSAQQHREITYDELTVSAGYLWSRIVKEIVNAGIGIAGTWDTWNINNNNFHVFGCGTNHQEVIWVFDDEMNFTLKWFMTSWDFYFSVVDEIFLIPCYEYQMLTVNVGGFSRFHHFLFKTTTDDELADYDLNWKVSFLIFILHFCHDIKRS